MDVNNTTSEIGIGEDKEIPEAWAVLFPWFVQILGVVVYFLISHYEIPVPYVAAMFIFGAIMGMGAFQTDSGDQLTQSILQWGQIDSATLLIVFLPGLLFRDAIEINFHYFSAALSQILLLAFPVVLAGAYMISLVAVYVFKWPWDLAITLGAIMGSTDPISVLSSLKHNDAPERLQMHLGGESLLNDGSAVVIYYIFSQRFFYTLNIEGYGIDIGWAKGVEIFFRMALGGLAVGFAFAAGLVYLLGELDRRLERENNVVQVAAAVSVAFCSYYVSEQVCQMSGILSCVTTGITASAFGKGLISDPELMDSYLALVQHLLNTLLFTLGGVVWGQVIANNGKRPPFTLQDWGFLLLLYVVVMLTRTIQIASIYPIMTRIGLKTNWQESAFLVFGGLRGAVGIALALSLDRSVRDTTDDPDSLALSNQLMGLSGGVTFLTLLINGALAAPVLRILGLSKPAATRRSALKLFEKAAQVYLVKEYKKRVSEPRFNNAKFDFVRSLVPFLSSMPQESMEQEILLGSMDFSEERSRAVLSRHNSILQQTMNNELEIRHVNTLYGSDRMGDEPRTVEEILTDVRLVFLEILKSAYSELVHRGELDVHEDNGYHFDVLRQSVTLAMESVNNIDASNNSGAPLSDFIFTQQFPDVAGLTKELVLHLGNWFHSSKRYRDDRTAAHNYQQMRIQVLVAMEFIEAHRLAEIQLHKYFDPEIISQHEIESPETLALVEDAVEQVLKESSDQVSLATSILTSVPQHDLEDISSSYLASILLHKLAQFIEQSLASGLLREKEASLYLKKVDKRIHDAHYSRVKRSAGGLLKQISAKNIAAAFSHPASRDVTKQHSSKESVAANDLSHTPNGPSHRGRFGRNVLEVDVPKNAHD